MYYRGKMVREQRRDVERRNSGRNRTVGKIERRRGGRGKSIALERGHKQRRMPRRYQK